ncbi:MAG: efflux RND transporter periplasmic adaptor subunit [Myxococcales bacterium]|nr:efflux RND transporter periplasmic adaptor subunit [Myxococcales bacterium]
MSVSSNGWHLRVSLVTLVSLLLSGCGGAAAGGEKRAMAASSKPSVDVVRLVYKPFRATTRLQGELSPFEAVSLYAKLNGFVSRVHVDRGSVVRKGARLVSLQAPELSARRAEAEAKVRASKGFHDRLKAAAKTPGAVAGNELALADAQLAGHLAKVRALRALEQYLNVVAPFSGVVTKRNVHTGALVGPATEKVPMLRLEQIATLRLTVPVPETLVAAVRVGTTETFTVRAWPGRTFKATVRRISRSINPRTRTMPVELDVDNRDAKLMPGMFAEVSWNMQRGEPSTFVPPGAIVESTEGTYVLRLKKSDQSIERVAIKRGATIDQLVEVHGALRKGDLIVRRGSEELRPGTRIKPNVVAGR